MSAALLGPRWQVRRDLARPPGHVVRPLEPERGWARGGEARQGARGAEGPPDWRAILGRDISP